MQQTRQYLEELIREINQAEHERSERALSPVAFAIYWMMNKDGLPEPERMAREMDAIFERYPHWLASSQHERDVSRELYRVLLNIQADHADGRTVRDTNKLTAQVEQILRVVSRAGESA